MEQLTYEELEENVLARGEALDAIGIFAYELASKLPYMSEEWELARRISTLAKLKYVPQ